MDYNDSTPNLEPQNPNPAPIQQNTPPQDERHPADVKKERQKIGRQVKSVYEYIKRQYDQFTTRYIQMYRHEFVGILPDRFLNSDRVDVNVVFPIVKTLIPALYYQDPKVFMKSEQEKISIPITQTDPETGEETPVIDPQSGIPMVEEHDGPTAALVAQGAINHNIKVAKVKKQVKDCVLDAHLGYYGAVKCGWGNEQGVASMGDGAPPSYREDVPGDMAYAIRLQPWNVCVDMLNFYNPRWIAIRYTCSPEQLRSDSRLQNTENIKGSSELDSKLKKEYWKYLEAEDLRQVEYYEVYYKPCAEYPNGKFWIITDEVKDDYLYESEWPTDAKDFPVKLLYFNPDPEGGLPIPDVKYYANQQKAKLNLRNAQYEFVQRSMPMIGIDTSGMKDPKQVKNQMTSGQIPRFVETNRNPANVISGIAYPSLNPDFHRFDAQIDDDVSRMVGVTKGVGTGGNYQGDLVGVAKLQDQNQQVRQSEKSDIVKDWLTDIFEYWFQLYQQYAGPENYAPIEGERFPVKWSNKQIQGKFSLEIKPYSMNYEDPVIRRRQFVDLLNLSSSRPVQQAMAAQGAQIDMAKIYKRVLQTYDERDIETFLIDEQAKPENQVAHAVQENMMIQQGQQVQVAPTDNHKVHIIVHGQLGELSLEHMMAHQQAMAANAGIPGNSPGGGNPGGMPVNGVAANQGMMQQPLQPSPTNIGNAIRHNASNPIGTR